MKTWNTSERAQKWMVVLENDWIYTLRVRDGWKWFGMVVFFLTKTHSGSRRRAKMLVVSRNGRKRLVTDVTGWKCVLWLGNERYWSKMGSGTRRCSKMRGVWCKRVVGLENSCGSMLGSENAIDMICWAQYSWEVTQKDSKRRVKTQDTARTWEQARETPKGVLTVLMMWQ